jgi:methylmalonyl-CoA epimerase
MIIKIDHLGIVVNDLKEALTLYTEALGLKVAEIETVDEQKVRVAMIPLGESRLELIESTDPEGPVGKYLAKKGEGLHHVALEVEDIDATLTDLKAKGISLIDSTPRRGAGGSRIAFLHPRSSKILIELVEH